MKITREVKIGLIFVITIILFLWGLNFLKGKKIFSRQRTFYAVYSQVGGLMGEAQVSINGLIVGRVSALHFENKQSARVIVEITLDNAIAIPRNSTAKIFSADLLGSKSLEIVMGNSSMLAEDGDTLMTSVPMSLSDEVNRQVQPIKKKAEDLMLSVDSVVTELRLIFNAETRDNLTKSFGHIRATLQNLETVSYNIDTLVYGQRDRIGRILFNVESITKNLKDSNGNLTKTLQNFANISDSLAKADISRTILHLDKALSDMAVITDKINKGEGSLGLLVNDKKLYRNLESSSKELALLLADLKLHPGRYVNLSLFGRSDKRNAYNPPDTAP